MSCEARADVDAMHAAAVAHGGIADVNPVQDHGFMYGRSFEDRDGHIFELMWLDLEAMQAAMSRAPQPAAA